MANYRAAARYAKSFLDLGIEQNLLSQFHDDMTLVDAAMESKELRLLAKSPIIKPSKKTAIFKTIFSDKVSETTMSFFNIIINKGRENLLPEIVDSFLDQYKKHKKITPIKLTTATQVEPKLLEDIKARLLQSVVTQNEVEIETSVDEDLIGGFVIEVGDKLYDASVLHKLNKIKKQFTENKYIKSF